uniref:Uncharacterized protein n=1 Tax=Setaria italica TaxID=4555 RepID=K4AGR9_SETIT
MKQIKNQPRNVKDHHMQHLRILIPTSQIIHCNIEKKCNILGERWGRREEGEGMAPSLAEGRGDENASSYIFLLLRRCSTAPKAESPPMTASSRSAALEFVPDGGGGQLQPQAPHLNARS